MKKRYWIAGSAVAAAGVATLTMRRNPRPRTFHLELAGGEAGDVSDSGSVQFIGTATTLIRFGGLTILTDPNFLHRGEQVHIGYGMHSTRLTDPAMSFEELPPVDFVLLSHLHEDHFDKLVEKRLAKDAPILTTASAARTLRRRGFTRLCAMNRWDRVNVRKGSTTVVVTAMPGTHGPLLVSTLMPDVMGSMLEFRSDSSGGEYRIYLSGDTIVFGDLAEIPSRYPNIDLALLHLGGTRIMGVLLTMDAEQGIEALRIVRPDLAMPIHYDDYDVFSSPLSDFQAAIEREGLAHKVRYLRRGETFEFAARGVKRAEQPLV